MGRLFSREKLERTRASASNPPKHTINRGNHLEICYFWGGICPEHYVSQGEDGDKAVLDLARIVQAEKRREEDCVFVHVRARPGALCYSPQPSPAGYEAVSAHIPGMHIMRHRFFAPSPSPSRARVAYGP